MHNRSRRVQRDDRKEHDCQRDMRAVRQMEPRSRSGVSG
jgi:hypothetical protein